MACRIEDAHMVHYRALSTSDVYIPIHTSPYRIHTVRHIRSDICYVCIDFRTVSDRADILNSDPDICDHRLKFVRIVTCMPCGVSPSHKSYSFLYTGAHKQDYPCIFLHTALCSFRSIVPSPCGHTTMTSLQVPRSSVCVVRHKFLHIGVHTKAFLYILPYNRKTRDPCDKAPSEYGHIWGFLFA